MTRCVRVLSIDGGGIRGIIPAMVLAEMEALTGRRVSEVFDLVCGTSTGGILALGLAKPGPGGGPHYTAAEMVALYEAEGERIFSQSWLERRLKVRRLAQQKYSAGGIEEVLRRYFGDARLSEAVTDVLITAYETERRSPFLFRSRRARREADYDFPMREAARATSAAPTYFPPSKLGAGGPREYFSLIDGGVYANNPAMCGYVEAATVYPDREDVLLVSLGTGQLSRPLRYQDVSAWGLARWAQPLLDVVWDGVSSTVDYQLQQLLPPGSDGTRRYWRFQARLDEAACVMDDVRPGNLRALKLEAEALLRDRRVELELLCRRLAR